MSDKPVGSIVGTCVVCSTVLFKQVVFSRDNVKEQGYIIAEAREQEIREHGERCLTWVNLTFEELGDEGF